MANANTSRDEVLEATWDFLDSLGPDREEMYNKLRVAADVCQRLAEGDAEARLLCIALLAMDRDFDEWSPDPVWVGAKGKSELWLGPHEIREVLGPLLDLRDAGRPGRRRPLSPKGQELWTLLDGRCLSGKELAATKHLNSSEPSVRQLVKELRRDGYAIPNRPGRGYYRFDAPPEEMMMTPLT